jgi:hypothetical protein
MLKGRSSKNIEIELNHNFNLKRPGREVYHSPPASGEAKNDENLFIQFPIILHGVMLNYICLQGQVHRYIYRCSVLYKNKANLLMGKVHLHYDTGHVISCVGNRTEVIKKYI